jgi:ABC-type uncharacterized transport system substrate-binding protein
VFFRVFAVAILITLSSCLSVKQMPLFEEGFQSAAARPLNRELLVLMDEPCAIYDQVLTGIHVASGGRYQLVRLMEENMAQTALFEKIMRLTPKYLITLGPRAANAFFQSNIAMPAAFAMVPDLESYEWESAFKVGVRMVPDLKERLSLVKATLPHVKSIGVAVAKNNPPAGLRRLRSLLEEETFTLVKVEVNNALDLLSALKRASHEFEAFLMLEDPVLLNAQAIQQMAAYFRANKIAFLALDASMVQAGALIAFSTDYFSLGQQLYNESLNTSKNYRKAVVHNPHRSALAVNLDTARSIGLKQEFFGLALEYAANKSWPILSFTDADKIDSGSGRPMKD